jgi:hypothetical protein
VRNFTLRIDDKVESMTPRNSIHRDNSGEHVWEWADEDATPYLETIQNVIKSRKAILRYNGEKYYHDEIVSAEQKEWLENILLVYRYLGGT